MIRLSVGFERGDLLEAVIMRGLEA